MQERQQGKRLPHQTQMWPGLVDIVYRLCAIDQFRSTTTISKAHAQQVLETARLQAQCKRSSQNQSQAVASRDGAIRELLQSHLIHECHKHGRGYMFSMQVSGAMDSQFATCLATLEDHLHTGVGAVVKRGPMVVKQSVVKTMRSEDSLAEELEEAFAENDLADIDALSLLDFAVGDLGGNSSEAVVPVFAENKQVHFKVAYSKGGSMRLPTVPIASGRRLTSADIVVTVHETVCESPGQISSIDRPQFISGYTPSRMGLLCVDDMNLETMQETSLQWKPGEKKYMINGIVTPEDNISIVTEFVKAAAMTTETGRSNVLRIPKNDPSSSGLLQRVHEFADFSPTLVTRVEETDVHEGWCLSIEASKKIELIHTRVEPTHMFKLPPTLPMICDMTSYQLALFLEDHCGFKWAQLPKKPSDRLALSFRPTDPQCPRFWFTFGRHKIDHYYLRALASASEEPALAITEVLHAQNHSYYMVLLGLADKKVAPQKLAVDDGDGDFPAAPAAAAKRAREPPLIEDDPDFYPLEIDDLADGEGDDMLEFAFEEMLDAHLAEQLMQDQADMLEDAFEVADGGGDNGGVGSDGGGDDDVGRLRAAQDPSASNHTLGPFRYTMKHKDGRFSWQCRCPFHRKNKKSSCRKTITLQLGTLSFESESDRVLCMLQHWANQAQKYVRQRHHVGFDIDDGSVPPIDVLKAQAILHEPRERPLTDVELDGGVDLAVAGSSDDGDGGDM